MSRSEVGVTALPGDAWRWWNSDDSSELEACRLPGCGKAARSAGRGRTRRFCSDAHRAVFATRRDQINEAIDAATRLKRGQITFDDTRRLAARTRLLLQLRLAYTNEQDALALTPFSQEAPDDGPLVLSRKPCSNCSGSGWVFKLQTAESRSAEERARQSTLDPREVERREAVRKLTEVIGATLLSDGSRASLQTVIDEIEGTG